MYRRFLSTIIFAILILTISGYGGAKSVDNSSAAQPAVQKMAELKVVKIQYSQNNSKAFIPQIRGMINTDLQTAINNNLKEALLSLTNSSTNSSLHGDIEVSFYNANLLGIQFTGDSFTPGMPYPNKLDCGIHIDLTTGQVYKLEDLFKPGVNFVKRIHELCKINDSKYRMKIDGLWDGWTNKTFAGSWTQAQGAFLLLDNSIRVYSIPFNATGAISGYNVPYADLMDIINTDGKLWAQIKSGEKPALPQAGTLTLAVTNNYEKANLNNLLANSPADQGQAVEIVLVPGERMFYEFPLHGSVGVSCRYIIEDNTIVKLTENKEVYIHPERSDIPGGDAAIGTFCFEAVQPGRTIVTLQHIFRGSIETEKRISVIVAD